jgi:hypothetical protein
VNPFLEHGWWVTLLLTQRLYNDDGSIAAGCSTGFKNVVLAQLGPLLATLGWSQAPSEAHDAAALDRNQCR